MSLLCDNNNYTKKKIISSMHQWFHRLFVTIMKDGIFLQVVSKHEYNSDILAHFTFFVCHNFAFCIVYVLFGGMIWG